MKHIALAIAISILAGCTMQTEHGACKGIITENERKKNTVYEVDLGNVIVGILFIETIAIPIITFGFMLWCPVEKKESDASQGDQEARETY